MLRPTLMTLLFAVGLLAGAAAEAGDGVLCASEGYLAIATWSGDELDRVAVVPTRAPLSDQPVVELTLASRAPVALDCRPGRLHIRTPDGDWTARGVTGRSPEVTPATEPWRPEPRRATAVGCAALTVDDPPAPTSAILLPLATDDSFEVRTWVSGTATPGQVRVETTLGQEVAKRFERRVLLHETLCSAAPAWAARGPG